MNKANELKTISALVKAILQKDKPSRNSDSVLYLKVLSAVCKEKGIDIANLTVPSLLLCGKELGLPVFETVRRTRQKLQAGFPELSANEEVQEFRSENEVAFREFARGSV